MILGAILVALVGCSSGDDAQSRPKTWWKGESGWCGETLTAAELDTSIALGREFLLANQYPAGNFVYAYDWKAGALVEDDNQVRQAGATWGLSLVHAAEPTAESRAALHKSLAFWKQHEVVLPDGRRYPTYPGDRFARLGTLSLVALAHVEALRTEDPELGDREALRTALHGYLAQILSLRSADGRFHDTFQPKTGAGFGPSSPYSDGEALLALVKAARYTGRADLWPVIRELAEAGYALNVEAPRAEDPDPDTTKGYYQWASMSWYEMLGSGIDATDVWGDRLIELAVWMIDTHKTLKRRKNTAYAYEGIVPAYAVAKERGDPRAEKLGCVVQLGLRKLNSWQVGNPLAIPYVAAAPSDPRSRGGIQNAADEPGLRVDVVQHQTHANMLARRLWASPAVASE